jgi:hypothetical protein
MKKQSIICSLGLAALVLSNLTGCALGEGRGFGTVDGKLVVEVPETAWESDGKQITITSLQLDVRQLQLEAFSTPDEYTNAHLTTAIPLGAVIDPVAQGKTTILFGPLEIGQGNYSLLGLRFDRVTVEGSIDGKPFSLTAEPPEGIVISADADLPVDRDHYPNITFDSVMSFDTTLLDGIDPNQPNAASLLVQNLAGAVQFDSTWSRASD